MLDVTLIAIQALGFLAAGVDIYATTHKNDRYLMLTIASASLLWAVHYGGLGAWAAVGTTLITASRFLSAVYFRKTYIAFIFMAFYLCAIPLTYQTPVDVLPYLSGFIATYALFHLKGISMRGVFIAALSFWFVFAFAKGSIPGILLNLILILGHTRTILALQKDGATTAIKAETKP